MAVEKKVKIKPFKLYGRSLFLLSSENAFRKFLANLTSHVQFDNVILVFIMISTGLLTLELPLSDPESD
jgi:hypothetical protein